MSRWNRGSGRRPNCMETWAGALPFGAQEPTIVDIARAKQNAGQVLARAVEHPTNSRRNAYELVFIIWLVLGQIQDMRGVEVLTSARATSMKNQDCGRQTANEAFALVVAAVRDIVNGVTASDNIAAINAICGERCKHLRCRFCRMVGPVVGHSSLIQNIQTATGHFTPPSSTQHRPRKERPMS